MRTFIILLLLVSCTPSPASPTVFSVPTPTIPTSLHPSEMLSVTILALKVENFYQLFGAPDEIKIGIYPTQHCPAIPYLLYYASKKLIIEVGNGSWNGPSSEDWVDSVTINSNFDNVWLQSRPFPAIYDNQLSNRQPWLGYGHLKDYLPEQNLLPSGPCQP